MKQITIYDLLPLLKKGWVAMDNDGNWWFYKTEPIKCSSVWFGRDGLPGEEKLSSSFNIAPFDGDWKDSLIKVEHKEEE
jgi:hypothetical protein